MSTTNLLFSVGNLTSIAENAGKPYLPKTDLSIPTQGASSGKSPDIINGSLRFGIKDGTNELITIGSKTYNRTTNAAYIYLDYNNKRYAITGPVDWTNIYNIPTSTIVRNITYSDTGFTDATNRVLNDVNGKYKALYLYDLTEAFMKRVHLPFLYANQADTITAPITLGGGDSGTAGKLIITPSVAGQITDHGTRTLFGFTGAYTNPDTYSAGNISLTIGHGQYSMLLRSTSAESTSGKASTYDYRPTIYAQANNNTSCTKRTVAYLEDTIPKALGDSAGNTIKESYISYDSLSITNNYTFNYGNKNNQANTLTLTDYYIGSLGNWTSNTDNSTLSTSLNYYKNGQSTADLTALTLAIPAATTTGYGIVTHEAQSFGGTKTFAQMHVGTLNEATNVTKLSVHGAIGLGGSNNINIYYNHDTDSVDFKFN